MIAKATIMDRGVYHWMNDQGTACIWGIAEMTDALSDVLLKKSLHLLIHMIPVLSARLELGLWKGCWKAVDPGDLSRCIIHKTVRTKKEADKALKNIISIPIDTDDPPCFKVITIDSDTVHYLALQVHHLIMDGEGAKQLFTLFAEIYRNLEKNPDWVPQSLPPMNRNWGQLMRCLKWHRFLTIPFVHARETLRMLGLILSPKKTTGVLKGDFSGQTESLLPAGPYFETTVLDSTSLEHLKIVCTRHHAKLNDVITAALMTTVSKWNRSQGEAHSHTTSVYTANLRRWWGQPAGLFANMSIIRLIRIKTDKNLTLPQALRQVKKWIDKEKSTFGLRELGDFLLMKIQPKFIVGKLGNFLKKLAKEMHGLTNIGIIPDSAGDFGRVKAVSYSLLAPPLASPSVIFTVSSFKHLVTIHGNFNAIHFKQDTARNFMAHFEQNLMEFADPQPFPEDDLQTADLPLAVIPVRKSLKEKPDPAEWAP